MTRFLKQPDNYSCGPVALLNLDKWRGIKVTHEDLPRYKRLCCANFQYGTFKSQMTKIVGKRGRRLSYEQFASHKGAAIINCRYRDGKGGHYFLVIGRCKGIHDNRRTWRYGWVAVNFSNTVDVLSPDEMRSILKRSRVWTFGK